MQLHQEVWQEVVFRLAARAHDAQHRWALGAPAEHFAKAGAATLHHSGLEGCSELAVLNRQVQETPLLLLLRRARD